MKFYTFRCKGKALPAVVVVMAKELRTARRIAKKWARDNGLDDSTVDFDRSEVAELPSIVYGWNGDY